MRPNAPWRGADARMTLLAVAAASVLPLLCLRCGVVRTNGALCVHTINKTVIRDTRLDLMRG